MTRRVLIATTLAHALVGRQGVRMQANSAPAPQWVIPVRYARLANGLKIVVSEDHSLPLVQVGVYYRIGDRLEPVGCAGFAHLCEHMMFQGSKRVGRGEHTRTIEATGGVLNASTRDDFTGYYQTVPADALEAVLSLEAERMHNLQITAANLRNQREVVKEEGLGLVKNRPYAGLLYVYLRSKAFDNYHNAHDSVSDFSAIDTATVAKLEQFYRSYYMPNNAVLALVGDVDAGAALARCRHHFGAIPRRSPPPPVDAAERPQNAERRFRYTDPLAPTAAVVVGYRMPPRHSEAYLPLVLLAEVLMHDQETSLAAFLAGSATVRGGVNFPFGTAFDTDGATLWTILAVASPGVGPEPLEKALDAAVAAAVRRVDEEVLVRALRRYKLRFYRSLEDGYRLQLLCLLALFDDDPEQINGLVVRLSSVGPAEVRAAATRYLSPTNRTLVQVHPGRRAQGEHP